MDATVNETDRWNLARHRGKFILYLKKLAYVLSFKKLFFFLFHYSQKWFEMPIYILACRSHCRVDAKDSDSEISRKYFLRGRTLRLAMHQRNEMHFSALDFDCFLAENAKLKFEQTKLRASEAPYIPRVRFAIDDDKSSAKRSPNFSPSFLLLSTPIPFTTWRYKDADV